MVSYKELGLVNTKELFQKAIEGKYAIPAFNFNNLEQLQAIIAACVETKSPVILQVSSGARKYANQTLLRYMAQGAVQYAKERSQFGKPIASFQLQQKKLAEFLTEITKAQLLCFQLGNLKNAHKATPAQISMAKRNNVKMAIDIARESRQILGGMGIMGDFPMMRHAANLESVITYEGTHDIHLLITGMDITGINAFG